MAYDGIEWVLAFDASCPTCRGVAASVAAACGDAVEVRSLTEVDAWRSRALGPAAPPAPTLLRVDGEHVRGWTGPALALRLARRLGPRRSLRVVCALGALRRAARGHPDPAPARGTRGGLSRVGFLRLTAGAAAAAGMVLAGRTPAFAEESCAAARRWAAEQGSDLPTTRAAISRYPMAYRRAIYQELTPTQRSRFWVDQVREFRAARPELTVEQTAVCERTVRLASDPAHFQPGGTPPPELDARLSELHDAAVVAFGRDEARELLASLGPPEQAAPAVERRALSSVACECADGSDRCNTGFYCQYQQSNCVYQDGCGTLGLYVCNGLCVIDSDDTAR